MDSTSPPYRARFCASLVASVAIWNSPPCAETVPSVGEPPADVSETVSAGGADAPSNV